MPPILFYFPSLTFYIGGLLPFFRETVRCHSLTTNALHTQTTYNTIINVDYMIDTHQYKKRVYIYKKMIEESFLPSFLFFSEGLQHFVILK